MDGHVKKLIREDIASTKACIKKQKKRVSEMKKELWYATKILEMDRDKLAGLEGALKT